MTSSDYLMEFAFQDATEPIIFRQFLIEGSEITLTNETVSAFRALSLHKLPNPGEKENSETQRNVTTVVVQYL